MAMRGGVVEKPVRPYIPPTAFLAIGSCASAACVMQIGWTRRAQVTVAPWGTIGALVVLGCALALFAWRFIARWEGTAHGDDAGSFPGRYVRLSLVFAGVGCAVAAAISGVELAGWEHRLHMAGSASVSAWQFVTIGDPSLGEYGASSTVELVDSGIPTGVRLRATMGRTVESGAALRVVGHIERLEEGDWARGRFMRGEVGVLDVATVLEMEENASSSPVAVARTVALSILDSACGPSRALLAGTVCGRVTELAREDAYDAFSRCGLTHLVAVSGSHLAYISAMLEMLLRRLRCGRAAKSAALLVVMALYVMFTGGAPSALRSVSMVGLATAAILGGRRSHAPSALALTVTALVWLNPGVVYDLGFQLSALSVLFIGVLGRYVSYALACLRLPTAIAEPLSLSLVAQWATLPVTLPVFGEVSLIAPLANLVVGPVMTGLLMAGLGATAVGEVVYGVGVLADVPEALIARVADAVLWLPDALAQLAIFLARLFAAVPFASMTVVAPWWLPVLAYGAAIVVYVRWRDASARRVSCIIGLPALLLVAHILRWSMYAPAQVAILDVGQADAILIRDGSRTMLVDAGVDNAVVEALVRNNVYALDAVVVTHWDRDHWGGLPDVLDAMPVGQIVVACGASAHAPSELSSVSQEIVEVQAGDVIRVGEFACRVVWPQGLVSGEENADSLCLDVSYDNGEGASLDMLLTGDTEQDELAEYADEVGDIDVLKVGHHGSEIAVAEKPLELLDPELAVASAGEGNSYGHPDPVCVSLLERAGARFLCTKDVGDVIIRPGKTGPVVKTQGIQ